LKGDTGGAPGAVAAAGGCAAEPGTTADGPGDPGPRACPAEEAAVDAPGAGGAPAPNGETPPGATPIIVFLPNPPGPVKLPTAGGDGVAPGVAPGTGALGGSARGAGGAGAPGAGPLGGATKPPTPTIVALRFRGPPTRGAAPVIAGRDGSAGGAPPGAPGDPAGGDGAGSLRTRNECPHFAQRIFRPEGGTRLSSI
jgi:hypothetical protein